MFDIEIRELDDFWFIYLSFSAPHIFQNQQLK